MTEANRDPLLERLRAEMAGDLVPERPLAPAWRRAVFLIPLWIGGVSVVLGALGFRMDYEILGPGLAWGMAATQLATAYLLMAVGLRLVIPGSGVSPGTLLLSVFFVMGLHLSLAGLTFSVSPVVLPVSLWWQAATACLLANLLLGLVPFGLGLLLASKGLPVRPLWVGGLCGLGGGLAAEAAWRMHCPVSELQHVLFAHTGGVLALAAAGILAGLWGQRRRPRQVARSGVRSVLRGRNGR